MTILAQTQPWLKQLTLIESYSPEALQHILDKYVASSGIAVIGGYIPAQNILELMHWPETRPDYVEQTIGQCEQAAAGLAGILNATNSHTITPSLDRLHCMMGLKVGGYDDGRIALIDEIADFKNDLTITPAHMISARVLHDGTVESYGEPTVILTGPIDAEPLIHEVGDRLEQYHYAIETHTATKFYETKWAKK